MLKSLFHRRFRLYRQLNKMDCGVACLKMITSYYGHNYEMDQLRNLVGVNEIGSSLLSISDVAESLGFETTGLQITTTQLHQIALPCILHWDQNHYVVLYRIRGNIFYIADPAKALIQYSTKDLEEHFLGGDNKGIVLQLNLNKDHKPIQQEIRNKFSWVSSLKYIKGQKKLILSAVVVLLITTVLQFFFPYLTKNMVDKGISPKDLNMITIILIAQLALTVSRMIADFVRTQIMLKLTHKLLFNSLSDFWTKLSKIPLSYFNLHQVGDIMGRISDHKQIQAFITGTVLSTAISIITVVIFSVILFSFNITAFGIYLTGSAIFIIWINLFSNTRKKLNYQVFENTSAENNLTLQFIEGMQDIRVNNAELLKRKEWEKIQTSLFYLNQKSLSYNQWQRIGGLLINQAKDILIIFTVAQMVVVNKLTLGDMLAIQYIIGQLNSPVEQIVSFIQGGQAAKISAERLNDIYQVKNEEPQETDFHRSLPLNQDIIFENLSFKYPGTKDNQILNQINLTIPAKKVTAIVGASGSGKTTIIKLLLKIFEEYEGYIKIGDLPLKSISPSYWRQQCGSVLQDGYLFNDTVERNIAMGEEAIDYDKLIESCKIADIYSFIEHLPNTFQTKIGKEGFGISTGQKQRILIARAIYRNPQFIFLDESTNALDTHTEYKVLNRLNKYFPGKTVVIVAHRLSTIRNADKIIVVNGGTIIEEGNHDELLSKQGNYYDLVKRQLESFDDENK